MTRRGRIKLEVKGVKKALRKIGGLKTKVARNAFRGGIREATQRTTRILKRSVDRGVTGLYPRSIAGKTSFDLARYIGYGISGQRTDKTPKNRRKGGRSSPFTARQQSNARGIRGNISGGLTGKGYAPPIHLVDAKVTGHPIQANKAEEMWWRIGKNNTPLYPWMHKAKVNHPGHGGKGIVKKTARRVQPGNLRIIRKSIENGIAEAAK